MDSFDVMVWAGLIALIVVVVALIGMAIYDQNTVTNTTTGKITNIVYSAGGGAHSDITSIYLDNGVVLAIEGTYNGFAIGETWTFELNSNGEPIKWYH